MDTRAVAYIEEGLRQMTRIADALELMTQAVSVDQGWVRVKESKLPGER